MDIFDFFKKRNVNVKKKKFINKTINKSKERKLTYFYDIYTRCLYQYNLNFDELAQFYNNNVCINCGCVLNIRIKNSRNCPECNNKIIIKTDVCSKRKIMLTQDMLKSYEKYDKEVREILFMERIMKNKIAIYSNYLNKFKNLKKDERFSARDIMYQFSNYVGMELDNIAYKKYMYSIKLSPQDRVLNSFDAILNFKKANQEYATLYYICMYEKKYNVAISALADVLYRDIQIVALDNASNSYHSATDEDFINCVMTRAANIEELINKSEYTYEEFKKIFLNQRHPFILPKISNEECWKYIDVAVNRFKKYKDR